MNTPECEAQGAAGRRRDDEASGGGIESSNSRPICLYWVLRGSLLLLILLVFSGCSRMPDVDRSGEGFRWPEKILTPEEKRAEAAEKSSRVVRLLNREHLSALLITTDANFAWITAGSESAGASGPGRYWSHHPAGACEPALACTVATLE